MASVFPRCFPSDDFAFRRVVEAAVARQTTPAAAQRRLRDTFPGTVVHRQERLAMVGFSDHEIWYFYRDGGLTRSPATVTDPIAQIRGSLTSVGGR
jgi:hypothetical protein